MGIGRIIRTSWAALFGLAVLATPHATVGSQVAESRPLTVFAAASATGALQEITELYEAGGHGAVLCVFASSGVLARQIDNGAPADLFLSANRRWMDWLVERDLIDGAPVALLGNSLVLIQPAGAATRLGLDERLARALGNGRLAIGDPDHVPAGIYARSALQRMGLWGGLERRLVRMQNVRAALLLVERGEAAAGIVYASDAAISSAVRVADRVAPETGPAIVYPAAIVKEGRTGAARRFLDYLGTPEAWAVFRRYGFAAP
jgi:molybdate transport system substrate-binding protein